MTLTGHGITLKGFHAVAPGDRRFYNNERPHHSLGMKTPAEAATMTGVSA